jgi:hypothetical protein
MWSLLASARITRDPDVSSKCMALHRSYLDLDASKPLFALGAWVSSSLV